MNLFREWPLSDRYEQQWAPVGHLGAGSSQ